jgi:predicted TIM-barrel fold metal-dependent hydrolase
VQEFPDVDELLRAMDAAGVERAVLLGWYWQKADTCAWHNRAMAAWRRAHPDRLEAWATIQPAAPAAEVEAELRRARDEGLSGLGELSPHSVGAALDAEGLDAALSIAADWGWAVNLHVTDPRGRFYPGKIETPAETLFGLVQSRPGVRFVLAHWAGGFDTRALSNVWVDTAAAPLLYGESAWAMRGETVRPERVLFGSDFPLRLSRASDAAAGWADFAAQARQNGLGSQP